MTRRMDVEFHLLHKNRKKNLVNLLPFSDCLVC